MRKSVFLLIAVVLFSSHDMYLKFNSFFFQPNSEATLVLVNGTFDESENVIDRDRMIDASLVGNGNRLQVDTADWSEKDNNTLLNFTTGNAGTWVAGVSTRPRDFEMTAEKFNDYLKHDGVLDMLKWREENNALALDAIERYSKHIKAIYQVGQKQTDDWKTLLGYPIEFVPMSNPYATHSGHELKVKLLWQGEPLVDQLVYVDVKAKKGHGHTHHHDHGEDDHDHADNGEHTHNDGDEHHHHSA
ncbi:MAG: DUF4198 domain-containing protein, partial [Bacteroidota bacterium]